jgi:hypothetical protein
LSVIYDVGCGNWPCVCDHSSIGEADVLSRAISSCSSDQQDIATATSIFNWLCSQIPSSTASLLPGVTVTNPSQWPGWSTIRYCAADAIGSVFYDINCEDWICVCEHSSPAAADLLSRVISLCSNDELDIVIVTSIFNGFCSQLPGVTGFQAVPTLTAYTYNTAAPTALGTTPACKSSRTGI